MTATNHGEQRLSCASYKAREASPPHLCSCNVGGGGIYLTLRKTLSTHCMHELADVHDWLVSAWSRGERGYAIPHSLRAWPILVWADRKSRVTQITTLYNCRAEKYNMSSLEVDGLQHEKAISGFTPLIHKQESDSTVDTDSPTLASWRLGRKQVFPSFSNLASMSMCSLEGCTYCIM